MLQKGFSTLKHEVGPPDKTCLLFVRRTCHILVLSLQVLVVPILGVVEHFLLSLFAVGILTAFEFASGNSVGHVALLV